MDYADRSYLRTNPTWHAEDSPWKAKQCIAMLDKHGIRPNSIHEIGCGVGGVITNISERYRTAICRGFDIAPEAISRASKNKSDRLSFHLGEPGHSDVLLALDVFEHVPDYMGFLERCNALATHKLYHVPLDIHVSAVLRDSLNAGRDSLGHLHYFTASTALATLRDTGHEIVDYTYTASTLDLFKHHRSMRWALANIPRWMISRFSPALAARLLGGFSLLVLCR